MRVRNRTRVVDRAPVLLWSTRRFASAYVARIRAPAPAPDITPSVEAAMLFGDCGLRLREVASDSIDLVCTDPPYGYSFAGLDWDSAVPGVDVWRECLRVMKPGAFAFVMSAPRADVLAETIARMTAAGFAMAYTPLFWTYACGMPKANDAAQAAMRRLNDRGRIVGRRQFYANMGVCLRNDGGERARCSQVVRAPNDARAIALTGAKLGFPMKPAVEVVLVGMKPVEGCYLDEALASGKGVTWVEGAKIPRGKDRLFPANLIVSDDILGAHSEYFSLDAWACELPEAVREQLPFLVCKKQSRRDLADPESRHPTQKPVPLMSWLITLGSRRGDVVLDPFAGSGTTGVAARALGRCFIGIEQDGRWHRIASERLKAAE